MKWSLLLVVKQTGYTASIFFVEGFCEGRGVEGELCVLCFAMSVKVQEEPRGESGWKGWYWVSESMENDEK